ncbi:MAG: HAD-IB family hydrolase [Chitinophagaceae bacterium]
MNERIAFFDFDGTITTKDSLLEFIKFYKGALYFYLGFLLYSPYLLAYKLKLIPNYIAKQKVLRFFFNGEGIETFQKKCDEFSDLMLPNLLRPKALKEIQKLKAANAIIVIVSASAENWIKKWASENELLLIGTRLIIADNKITGTINGKNCYGEEKVCRIEKEFDLTSFREIYCYGDSDGDKAMLQLATFPFFKPFR